MSTTQMTNCKTIIDTMQVLRDQGWCIVLKALPPHIGWLLEGSRSEYDGPSKDQRIGKGKWCCEAQWCGDHKNYRASQFALADTPIGAVVKVATQCAEELKRNQ